jgi:hypothetical protein
MICFVHAVLSIIVENNILPLYAQYGQCACVNIERILPPVLPFHYINQAIMS